MFSAMKQNLPSRVENEEINRDDRCQVQVTEDSKWREKKIGKHWKTTGFRVKELKSGNYYFWHLLGVLQ